MRLGGGQVADAAQQVVHAVDAARVPVGGEPGDLALDLGERVGVEQLAQLGRAEQLGQQRGVERRAPARVARPAARRPRTGTCRRSRTAASARTARRSGSRPRPAAPCAPARSRISPTSPGTSKTSCRHSRIASSTIGKSPYSDGDLQQLVGPLALLPQRRAPARVAARQQQRARRALAEPGREQRRTAHLGGDDRLDLVRVEDGELGAAARSPSVSGRRSTMPSSECMDGDVQAVPLAQPGGDGQRPRRVHLRAERRVHDQPPVAELVAEPLDQDVRSSGSVPVASRCSAR